MWNKWRYGAVTLVLVAIMLVALTVHVATGAPHPARTAHAAAAVLPAAISLGPTSAQRQITIGLVLRGRAPAALAQLMADIGNPASAQDRHFLSPDAFAQRFGPAPAEYATVGQILRVAHFTLLTPVVAGSLLWATGTAAQVETLFGVQLDDYRAPDGGSYYAARGAPRIPAELQSSISGVLGLDSRPQVQHQHVLAATTPNSGLAPSDLARAYDLGPLQAQGLDGTNQSVALAEIDTFHTSDIATYDHAFGITAPAMTVIPVAGGASGTSPEAPLDIEVLHAIAPHAHLIVYEGPSDLAALAQIFNQMVVDHRAQIISISLGICELDGGGPDAGGFVQALNSTFQQADAEGMSVLAASGDSGAYGCQNNALSVTLPASSPNVTAVGGTTLFLNAAGAYDHEASWEGPLESVGTGGGLSQMYRRPAWQTGAGVDNAASNGMRQVPDIAADADPLSGYLIYASKGKDFLGNTKCDQGGCWQVTAGTSAATPLWAGLIALANQAATAQGKPQLGFLNPTLYTVASSGLRPAPLRDVTTGGNLYYNATPGWDYCTGWGTPDAAILVPDLVAAEH